MKRKSKTVLLFPDGVGIRNYLYSGVFKDVEDQAVLLHAFDYETQQAMKEITSVPSFKTIPNYNESLKEKFLRELICLARLNHNVKLVGNDTILSNWKIKHNTFSKRIFYRLISITVLGIRNYKHILKLEKFYQKAIRKSKFYYQVKDLLVELDAEKVFCSHQRGIQCAPIFAAAQDLGMESITVIYSWDNLPKARMALQANKYLVWSDYMKQELHLYYPEINNDAVLVTGTPQFECYQNTENIIAKNEFYKRYDLDINKKIICYSGDDVLTCPDDPQYLSDLADELVRNDLDKDYQILLRRCPVDVSGRFDTVVEKYPTLIKQAPPLWNFEPDSSWTTIYPLHEDIPLLVSTVYYSDVVVNLGSTMAFDFAMFQKPCIYINYDQEKKVNPFWSVNRVYAYQHFKSMPNPDAVLWWNSKDTFFSIIEVVTSNYDFKNIEEWGKIVIGDSQKASQNISNLLFYEK